MIQPVPNKARQAASDAASPSVLHRIQDLLTGYSVSFDLTHHRPVFTSADAAEVREKSLHSGARALAVKADDRFVMPVLSGDHSLDSRLAGKVLGAKSIRFACREEVPAITRLEPGPILPLGSLLGLHTCRDAALRKRERINFNAGSHSDSLRVLYTDYEAVERPARRCFRDRRSVKSDHLWDSRKAC